MAKPPPSQLSLIERLSYGLGNFGVNLLFGMTGAYLMYFYTDVYHVAPATIATLFLVARGADALFDPLLGLLIDRTNTRFGKHRPYLIVLAVPFALCGIAIFATPALGDGSKILYIYVTYTLLGLLYSGISLPLNSMLPTLTRDPAVRTSTNALREFMGSSATVGISYAALPLVGALGGGSEARGFLMTAIVLGSVTVVALVIAFFNTRERVEPVSSPRTLTTRQSLRAARGNRPWLATMMVNFFFWVGFIAHVQSVVYYAKDVLGQPALVSSIMLTMVAVLVGTALSAVIANRIGKRVTGIIGSTIAALGTAALTLSSATEWVLVMNVVAYFGLGLIGGLLFALMADAVDYGEWKSGFRAQGFLFAASSFGVKLGMSVGGAAGALLLSRSGYVAGAPLTAAVVDGITWGHIWVPVLSYAGMGASLLLFTMHKDFLRQVAERTVAAPLPAPHS